MAEVAEAVRERAGQIRDAYQRIAANMYTLDAHGGRRFLRDSSVSGATAEVAAQVTERAGVTWAQFDELRRLAERLPAADGWGGLRESEIAAASTLVTDDVVQLDAHGIPVHASAEPAKTSTDLKSFGIRVEADCVRLLDQCTDVDTACGAVADQAADITTRLEELNAQAEAEGMSGNAALIELRERHGRELNAALSDPLTAARDNTLAALEQAVAEFGAELSRFRQIRTQYPQTLDRLRTKLTELSTAESETMRACDLARTKIANPATPVVPRWAAGLSADLRAAEQSASDADWHGLARQLTALDGRIDRALRDCRQCADTAAALLDRRTELRGRFSAYTRKAARTGVIESAEVATALAQTKELLSVAPCDLPAATSALHRFQQAISGTP